ncbi:uncharacterized protein LOC112604025 [Melanaphis sacchari]|uniref:uncharacterized protein LOC112604025 n=1 Tax=Melanaphis sacchari TaxID=742174 RepID=UPI000DC1498F|nr:uncharacterized protein LOC112604025 [Melanaphis sacchari]
MSSFEVLDVAFNIKLYKLLRFYDIFDPKSTKIFGYNFYRVTGIIITVLTQSYILFGQTGFFMPTEDTINYIEKSMLIFVNSMNFLAAMKTCVFIYKANNIWDLFDVTRINFLKSEQCCKYRYKILEKVRNKSIRLTNFIVVFAIISLTIWIIYPLVINFFLTTTGPNNHQGYQSILYLRYPVTTNTYNQYYFVFYTTEAILAFGIIYYSILVDTVLVSLCWIFIAQYEILSEAFGNIKYDDKEKDGSIKAYNDFLSVLNDQRRLNS